MRRGLFQDNEAKAGLIGTYPVVQNPFNFSTFSADADWFVMCGLRAFCTWSAISGFILLFKTFFDRQSALGRYASDSSYFIYLIHFPIQICIGRHLRDHVDSAFACFLINLFVSLILCVALYHYLCRNTWIGVMLSGQKISPKCGQGIDRTAISTLTSHHQMGDWIYRSRCGHHYHGRVPTRNPNFENVVSRKSDKCTTIHRGEPKSRLNRNHSI